MPEELWTCSAFHIWRKCFQFGWKKFKHLLSPLNYLPSLVTVANYLSHFVSKSIVQSEKSLNGLPCCCCRTQNCAHCRSNHPYSPCALTSYMRIIPKGGSSSVSKLCIYPRGQKKENFKQNSEFSQAKCPPKSLLSSWTRGRFSMQRMRRENSEFGRALKRNCWSF